MNEDLPALLGGPPAIPGGPPRWPPNNPAVAAALAAAGDAWGQYHGPHVAALEAALCAAFAVPHALTCASGTLAVEAALRAVGVGPGDEVILAAYEYDANFLTLHAIGAVPVLIDVRPADWQMNADRLTPAFTAKTKAVLATHLHGGLVDMPAVCAAAAARGVPVVEDAAQVPGAVLGGRPAGSWGDAAVMSFGGSKLLAAGRGGAVLGRSAKAFQRAKLWLSRGVQQWAALSELQAAVLRPQLAALPAATATRRANVELLLGELADIPGLTPFAHRDAADVPAFYKLGFQFDPAAFGLSRESFVAAVRAEGAAFDAGFSALHVGRSPSRFRAAGDLTESAAAGSGCAKLHHPVLLGDADGVRAVARAVRKVYRNAAAIRRG